METIPANCMLCCPWKFFKVRIKEKGNGRTSDSPFVRRNPWLFPREIAEESLAHHTPHMMTDNEIQVQLV
jgi:hypothetical protein